MKKKKILAIILIILILFTNYAFAAGETTIKYTNQRTGGNKVSSIANVIGNDYYLNGNYNAKSMEAAYSNIKIYNYKTATAQQMQGSVLESSQDIPQDYSTGKYYIFADKSSASSGNGGTIKYGIRLPAGDVHLTNVVTIVHKGGLKYNGETYDVHIDIKEINKTGTSPIVLSSRLGSKSTEGTSTNPSDYTIPTCPTLGAELAEAGQRDFQMEVSADYYVVDENGNKISISGVWGVEDVDGSEGLVIDNFIATAENTFIKQETLNDSASDENLKYKKVDNNTGTYIFAPEDTATTYGHAYFLMNDRETLGFTKTWDGKTFGALFKFQDDVIQRYNNIITKVTGGTITPSMTEVRNGENKTIEYSPNDATKQYLKSVTVDGTAKSTTTYASSYNFTNVQEDHTIEVVYANKYVVKFDTQGGTPTPNDQYVNPNEKATEPTTAPTRTGYTFVGWTLNNTAYNFNTPVTKDITLVAKWTPVKYHIYYELDGGTNHADNPSEYTIEDSVTFKDPTRTRYIFDGWYTTAEKTTRIREIPVGSTGDKTIYAKWLPASGIEYKVQHYKMGTNGVYPTTPTLEETETGTVGQNVTATPYNFTGYEEDTTYTGRVPSGTIPDTGTLTLKLYYKPLEYTITYVLNGGTNAPSNPPKYTVDTETITFADATRDGYTFRGWYSDVACTQVMNEIPKGSTGNKTVYAKWEANSGVEYNVEHYLKKNGQYELELTDTLAGSTGSTVTATAKEFPGYEENINAEGRIASGTIPTSEKLVLRLYYDPITYRINYILNGGTNHSDNPSTYTVDKVVTFKDPTREGYTFLGWYEEAGFTTSIRSTANKVGDITIYAKWNANSGVAYKVEHYLKQNGEYKLADTDDLTGTVNEQVTATPKTYAGYEENTTTTERVPSGTIPTTGTLVLKLYYDPITYRINYVLNGGTNHSDNPSTYTVDKVVTFKDPTRTGYTFKGWYEEAGFTTSITSTTNKTGDITIYAKWDANDGVAYKVEHYLKQNGEYKLVDTDDLTGTVNEQVTATPKTYAGYEENTTTTERVPSGTIPTTGTLVLKLYYDPITYRINYVLNGGTNHSDNPSTYTVDKVVTFKDPTREGYTFLGWYEEAGFTTSITSTTNKTGDLTIYAKWNANSGVTYKVEHYLKQNGEYKLADTDNLTGVVNEQVTAVPKTYAGYVENTTTPERVVSGTIPTTGTLVLKLYYDPITYKITYVLNGGTNHSDNPSTYTVDKIVTFKDPTREGYTFLGWYEEAGFTTPITSTTNKTGDLTIYANWQAKGDTGYKVEHYKKNAQDKYNLAATDTYTGTTGVTVTATPKVFKGYEENINAEGRVATGTIKADGSLVLELYYDPIIYHINYVLNGGVNDSRNPATYTVNDNITLQPATREGYEFKGWFEHAQFIGNRTTTITDRAEDITLYAKWEAKDGIEYKVEHYKQKANGEYELASTNTLIGKTDEEVTAVPMQFTGYIENTTHPERVISGTIPTSGTLVLKLYYDRIKYTVSFEPRNGTQINDQKVPYQEKATEPEKPVKNGYTFGGWTLNDTVYNFNTPVTADITLIAKWTPIKYQINYELDGGTNNPDNPFEYTIEDTVTFKEPTKTGYIFEGWYTTADKTTRITEIPIGSTGDKTIYAKWTPKSGIEYKVEHYKMGLDGKYPTTATLTETKYGTVGVNVTATPQNYSGYEEDTTVAERKVAGIIPTTGTLTLKLYYKLIEYSIEYELNGGTNDPSNPSKYTVETETITFAPATKTGYTFKGWYLDAEFKTAMNEIPKGSTGNKKVYAKWEPSSGVEYKVEHYKKNSQGEYKLATTTPYTGTTGDTVTAIPMEFKGYKENETHPNRIATGTIKADGSLVLKLYYDPIIYNIDYVLNGGVNNPENPTTYTVNDNINLKPAEKEGYEFKGWFEDKDFKGEPTTTITDRAENITLYAKWEAKPAGYKVEHYKETKNGEYELAVTKTLTGKTDEEVTAAPLEFEGYTENTKHAERVTKGTIKSDGSLVLKLYYDKIVYTVSFDPQNGKKIDDQKVPYSEKAQEPTKPTKEGYEFSYWYYEDENGGEVKYDFNTPVTSDIKLIAKYVPIKDDTTAPTVIPQTGQFNGFAVFGMIALVTLAGAFGIRFFNLKKIMK